ncbi:hypothetical protein COJ01_18125 [Priestia megaterium]|jgi:hypothetical protein|uniref:hypothetical protein n=1 Tax=Priestia megaterium TaxID=1404 RepID=UPI000BF4884A|nr:hypothetical protein [Priestia megaterium]PFK99962.1 hypothetical protein COJ01_18125 [Priestia megaterium]
MFEFFLAILAVGVASAASFLIGAYVYGSYKYELGKSRGYQEGYSKCGDDMKELSSRKRRLGELKEKAI